MNWKTKYFPVVLATTLLAACGGGDSGANTAASSGTGTQQPSVPIIPPAQNADGLSFNPGVLELSAYSGEAPLVTFSVDVTKVFTGTVNVRVSGMEKLTSLPVHVQASGATHYNAMFRISEKLAPGIYDGNIRVDLCKDDANVCSQRHNGSPWLLPYRLEVKEFASATSLTALAPVSGMTEWITEQGGISHAGYAPLTVDASRIAPRFGWFLTSKVIIGDQPRYSPVVSSNGIGYFSVAGKLVALNERTGTVAWQYSHPDSLGSPAIGAGKVFLADAWNKKFLNFDLTTGLQGSSVLSYDSIHPDAFFAPTIDGNTIAFGLSDSTGVGYDITSNKQLFSVRNRGSSGSVGSTVALDSDSAYLYSTGKLFQVSRQTGNVTRSVSTLRNVYNDLYAVSAGAVLHSGKRVLFAESIMYGADQGTGTLFNVDMAAGTTTWVTPGKFNGRPVVSGDTAYAVNGDAISAVRLADGSIAWNWPIPGTKTGSGNARIYNLVTTGNMLFASGETHTYAIDLASRTRVWTFDRSGKLSMSRNGILYLSGKDGVFAFNLK